MNAILDRTESLTQVKPTKEERERSMEMARPVTPKSERPRKTWGSLAVSVQTVRGLCLSAKCVRKENHDGACWPV